MAIIVSTFYCRAAMVTRGRLNVIENIILNDGIREIQQMEIGFARIMHEVQNEIY